MGYAICAGVSGIRVLQMRIVGYAAGKGVCPCGAHKRRSCCGDWRAIFGDLFSFRSTISRNFSVMYYIPIESPFHALQSYTIFKPSLSPDWKPPNERDICFPVRSCTAPAGPEEGRVEEGIGFGDALRRRRREMDGERREGSTRDMKDTHFDNVYLKYSNTICVTHRLVLLNFP